MLNSYKIPEKLDSEINGLEDLIQKALKGKVDPISLKAHRVPFGIYEQRSPGTYMVRVRCTAGIITPEQLEKISDLSLLYGSGRLHVTTRQEIQIHDVKLENLSVILKDLKSNGLSTRGGGGNTVRNIIASPDAGVSVNEVFDVTPYAVALTSRLIAENDSWELPRKYKIAFSGSSEDDTNACMSDLGFIARVLNGKAGFSV